MSKLQETAATFGWFRPASLGRPLVFYGLRDGEVRCLAEGDAA